MRWATAGGRSAMLSLFLFLLLLLLISLSNSQRAVQVIDSSSSSSSLAEQSSAKSSKAAEGPSEQEKIDTILRAFRHLPSSELERLNVTLEEAILVGTDEAVALKAAWITRQAEIKAALGSMVQPMELMGNITNELRHFTNYSVAHLVASLDTLEGLLSDMDNARDYFTQGLWPELVASLSKDRPVQVRQQSAWYCALYPSLSNIEANHKLIMLSLKG